MSNRMGAYNGSSIEGGIFGTTPATQAVPPQRNVDNVLAGSEHAPATTPRDVRTNGNNASSIDGGIFGQSTNVHYTPRNHVTNSSIAGGIFGGASAYNVDDARDRSTVVPDRTSLPAAGVQIPTSAGFSLADNVSSPLQPLQSARANPNVSSIEGGIFGPGRPAQKPGIQRNNPNASSITGGIFG